MSVLDKDTEFGSLLFVDHPVWIMLLPIILSFWHECNASHHMSMHDLFIFV